MIVRTDSDWDKLFERFKSENKVPLLCDGFRVLLMTGAKWSKMKLTIMPLVEGVFIPDHLKPLWNTQSYDENILPILQRFYDKKIVYAYSATERNKLKKRISKKAYVLADYDRYQYYYESWDSFKSLKKHYGSHLYRIELLESESNILTSQRLSLDSTHKTSYLQQAQAGLRPALGPGEK